MLLLGWLKQRYYLATWGVDPGLLGPAPWRELAFEAWFPAQNAAFFALLLWAAVTTRLRWVAAVTVALGLLPIAAHYAFALPDGPVARAAIDGRHGALKLVPFAVLALVWFGHRDRRDRLLGRSDRPAGFTLIVMAVVVGAWAISTAKHSGSYDALLAMRRPETRLARLVTPPPPGAAGDEWYVVGAGARGVAVWDRRAGESPTILVVPAPFDTMRLERPPIVQPGGQFW